MGFSISWNTYEIILYAWIGLAIITFFFLLKVAAPYGRHSSSGWGPMISNKWSWLFMELPVLLVLWILISIAKNQVGIVSWIMIGLFSFHYFNRVFVFPFRIHTKGKKMPLIIMLSAVFFNLVNGFSFGYFFTRFADYPVSWFTDPRFISGLLLFLSGVYINWKGDNLLIQLRKAGETGYKIPFGWMFEKISCPNLFGELIEWLGFAILCWNLPALTFFIWTTANLIPRAISHHKWYKEKFDDYPANRKVIIPFVL